MKRLVWFVAAAFLLLLGGLGYSNMRLRTENAGLRAEKEKWLGMSYKLVLAVEDIDSFGNGPNGEPHQLTLKDIENARYRADVLNKLLTMADNELGEWRTIAEHFAWSVRIAEDAQYRAEHPEFRRLEMLRMQPAEFQRELRDFLVKAQHRR